MCLQDCAVSLYGICIKKCYYVKTQQMITTPGVDKTPNIGGIWECIREKWRPQQKDHKVRWVKWICMWRLILLIDTSSFVGKVAFGLVKNVKSKDFSEGNSKVAWDRLVSKYVMYIALSLLKLKSEFHNSKLESIDKDPNEDISHLEELCIWINKFRQKGSLSNKDFMIQFLNNLPKEYDVILNGLENCLTAIGDDVLTIDLIRKNWNTGRNKLKVKKKKKAKKKRR